MMALFASFWRKWVTVVGHEPLIPMWKLFRRVSSLVSMLTRKRRGLVLRPKSKLKTELELRKSQTTISRHCQKWPNTPRWGGFSLELQQNISDPSLSEHTLQDGFGKVWITWWGKKWRSLHSINNPTDVLRLVLILIELLWFCLIECIFSVVIISAMLFPVHCCCSCCVLVLLIEL